MSIAKQGSFKDIKAFLDKFKLFRLLAHLPMLKAFRVIPAPMYADMRFAMRGRLKNSPERVVQNPA